MTSNRLVAGWPLLLRVGLRRERIILPVTVVLFALMSISTAVSISAMYSDPKQLEQLRASAGSSAAFVFLLGPVPASDSLAAFSHWRAGLFMVAALGVCAVLAVVRQTRKEEEAGRTELLLAGAVGPFAPLLSATLVVVLLVTATSAVMAAVIAGIGGSSMGVVAVFLQYWATGIAAAGTALVAAEAAASAHSANLIGAAVVAAGYLLRGVADATPALGWLRWLSPMGWAEAIDPFGANRLWLAVGGVAVFLVGAGLAAAIRQRRDLGAGLLRRRPGPARGPARWSLLGIIGRVTRAPMQSWIGGTASYALVVGALAPQVESMAAGNAVIEDLIKALGQGSMSEMFVTTMMIFLAVAAAGGGVGVLTAMRAQERSGRAELLLSTPVSRTRYYLTYVVLALLSSIGVLLASAIAVTVGAGVAGGELSSTATLAFSGAAVAVPAVALTVAVAFLAHAVRSSWALVGWPLLLVAFACGPMAELFGLPHWLRQLSPFTHTPSVPVQSSAWLPLTVMTLAAIAVFALGVLAFRRRDIG